MKRVVVHVDRLVLKGFRHEDQHAIAAGMRQELERVFTDREAVSLLRARRDVSRLEVGDVHIEHGSQPQRVGENVARGIGKEMRK
jgi:hypothetical protein